LLEELAEVDVVQDGALGRIDKAWSKGGKLEMGKQRENDAGVSRKTSGSNEKERQQS